ERGTRERVVVMRSERGPISPAHGVERLVRNDLWRGRSPERFYDSLEWLYGWRVERALFLLASRAGAPAGASSKNAAPHRHRRGVLRARARDRARSGRT